MKRAVPLSSPSPEQIAPPNLQATIRVDQQLLQLLREANTRNEILQRCVDNIARRIAEAEMLIARHELIQEGRLAKTPAPEIPAKP
jgi:hypothetical protein